MRKEKLDKYTKERFIMGYQLDEPKSKAQEILCTRNSQEMEKRVITHTHCSSKPSLDIYLQQQQKEAEQDEPLS